MTGSALYRVRHIKCYRAIALKIFIISKNVSDKSFSVREGRHTGPPYFFIGGGAEATSRSTPLCQIKPCIFFSMTLLPILRRISDLQHKVILVRQSMKIVRKSKHIGIITLKGSTNLGLGLPTEDARSDDPRLVSTC